MRPQHIELADDGVPGDVQVVEPTGEDQFLSVRMAGADISVVAPGHVEITAGDTIMIRPDADNVLLFDPATGSRLS